MPFTAWLRPTTNPAGSGVTSPTNVYSSDNLRATFGDLNDTADYGSFGNFAIPAGSTIHGIVCEVEGKLTGVGINHLVGIKMYLGGAFQSTGFSFDPTSTVVDEIQTFGSSSAKWNGTPVDTDFADGTFQVRLTCDSLSASTLVEIDSFRVQVYYAPTITITGTLGTYPTAEQIQQGGRTIILTLAGDTWVASGATFDAQRQGIINGLTSDRSDPYGWTNIVRANQSVSGVVRTSDTVVTITLDAFPTYYPWNLERIVTTVPNTAVTTAETPATATVPTCWVSPTRRNLYIRKFSRPRPFGPGIAL